MNTFFTFLITILMGNSCYSEKHKCEIVVEQHFIEKTMQGKYTSFTHYLTLEKYEDECFNKVYFIKLANSYIDTLSDNKPVGSIYFSKVNAEFDTSGDPDYQHWDKIRDKFIISIDYSLNSIADSSIPSLVSVSIWQDGIPKTIFLN